MDTPVQVFDGHNDVISKLLIAERAVSAHDEHKAAGSFFERGDAGHIDLPRAKEGFWDVAALSRTPLVATHSNAHALAPTPRNLTDRQLDAIKDSGGIVGVNFFVGFLRADGKNDEETPISRIVEHFNYLVERMGLDHVGFGADMDGALIPREVGDMAGLPRVVDALRQSGYDEPALKKLAHENWLRVLGETWKAH